MTRSILGTYYRKIEKKFILTHPHTITHNINIWGYVSVFKVLRDKQMEMNR